MGLLLIIIGGFLFLSHLGIVEPELPRYIYSWKMLLVVFGVVLLLSRKNKITGLILILIGGVFLSRDIFDLELREVLKLVLPSLLIVLGLLIIFKRSFSGRAYERKSIDVDSVDHINETNIFGGTNKIIKASSFKGGQVTSIFGGCEIDLTECNLSEENSIIEVLTVFGGSTFIVPDDWTVKIDVAAVFGGSSDERVVKDKNFSADPEKVLILKGTVVFGGLEIK